MGFSFLSRSSAVPQTGEWKWLSLNLPNCALGECNPVGPSPDVGVGGTTACSGIVLRVYYYITVVVVVVFVLLCSIKPKNLLKQPTTPPPPLPHTHTHKLCDRCNIRGFFGWAYRREFVWALGLPQSNVRFRRLLACVAGQKRGMGGREKGRGIGERG